MKWIIASLILSFVFIEAFAGVVVKPIAGVQVTLKEIATGKEINVGTTDAKGIVSGQLDMGKYELHLENVRATAVAISVTKVPAKGKSQTQLIRLRDAMIGNAIPVAMPFTGTVRIDIVGTPK
jgi:hypothetical protein